MKAYFLSGIGADKRAFGKIRLPENYSPVYLEWIKPLEGETLSQYASRMSAFIPEKEEFILIGLSFGGMVASEIAKIRSPQKIIIISSIASSEELPWYFKRAGKLGLHKILPIGVLKKATVLRRIFGVGRPEDKAIVFEYVKNADPSMVRWSLGAIIEWDHRERIPGLVHIHGNKDHLLPTKYLRPDFTINRAGHLMVLNMPDEINRVLASILSN